MRSASGNNDPNTVFIEVRIGVEAGTAQAHSDDLSSLFNELKDIKMSNESE